MNNRISIIRQILVIIFIVNISLMASAATSNSSLNQMQAVTNLSIKENFSYNNQENSISNIKKIVISIDSSNSMKGNKLDQTKRYSTIFAKNALENGAEIGVVGWNDAIDISVTPSFDLAKIYNSINGLVAHGNTCIGSGLSESIDILRNEGENNSKYIILLSDGETNCTNLEDPCMEATRARNLGIKIFLIKIGPNEISSLNCITEAAGGHSFYLSNINELGDVYNEIDGIINPINNPIYNNVMIEQSTFKNERGSEFSLLANASIIGVKDASTNVTVEKMIDYDEINSTPKLILKISTPPIDKMDIVFSLDSSGSIGLSNQEGVIRNGIKNSINSFIDDLNGKNISARFAVVSWDDAVDFIYKNNGTNFIGIDPNNTILVNSTTLKNDLDPRIIAQYHSDEEETTDLETGIINPLLILKNNKPLHPSAFRCIVLVVGRSEFKNYTGNMGNTVKSYPFKFYPIGMNPGKELEKSLKNLADISNGKYIYSTGAISDFSSEFDSLLKEFLIEAAYNTSVAQNVIIYDSLYPYLKPDLSSLKGAKLLSYDSKTNTIAMEIVGGMLGGHTYEISFDTSINLELPVDVSRNRSQIGYNLNNLAPVSNITYVWHTNKIYSLDLPENQITIKNSKLSSLKQESPSNYALLSLIAILLICLIRRK